MATEQLASPPASVDLYWLPLGAGDNTHCVRTNGRIFEWATARYAHREGCDLYHAALEASRRGPARHRDDPGVGHRRAGPRRGVRGAGRPEVARRLEVLPLRGPLLARRGHPRRRRGRRQPPPAQRRPGPGPAVLSLGRAFPTATWGRDELRHR